MSSVNNANRKPIPNINNSFTIVCEHFTLCSRLIDNCAESRPDAYQCCLLETLKQVPSIWATICKTVPLCYQSVVCLSVCPVLSVTLVYYGQTVGWIKMKLGMQVSLSPGYIVLRGEWGPSSPSPKGEESPNFQPISVVAERLDASRCYLVGR